MSQIGVVEKVKKSPLLRDMATSSAFVLVGIIGYSSIDPLLSHLAGAAIGLGGGYAIRSLQVHRKG